MQLALVMVGRVLCLDNNEGSTNRANELMRMGDCIYPVLQRTFAVAENTCCLAFRRH